MNPVKLALPRLTGMKQAPAITCRPRRRTKSEIVQQCRQALRQRDNTLNEYCSDHSSIQNLKMLSHLGKGSFSVVTLGVDRATERRFAIKTYAKLEQMEDHEFDNIRREISNLNGLKHRNVVELVSVVREQNKILLVMEDAGKMSLAGLLRKQGKMDEPTARSYMVQILDGLAYCHQKSVCHRDLKLENILVSDDNILKLIDFGFSARCNDRLNTYCGTPPYMAPEVTLQTPYNGRPVDIWSAGIIFFLLLHGKFPFIASDERELFRLIQKHKIQIIEGISAPVRNLLCQMLEKDSKNRPSAEVLLQDKWFQEGRKVVATN